MNQIKNIENFRAMSLNDYNESIPLNLSNQEFTLFFLNVNDDIKKVILDNEQLFNKVMMIPPNRYKKTIIELVSDNVREHIIEVGRKYNTIYYQKNLFMYLEKMNYDKFSYFINLYNLNGENFMIDKNEYLNKLQLDINEKEVLTKRFNPIVFLKAKNKYEVYIYAKFNILVDIKELKDGKLYFDNDIFVEYDLLKNISPKHIKKLLRALQEKDNTLDNNKLFISAIKIYSLFGYDNSKKIIDDFFTYATPLSCQSSARELHKDERRQFRLENQEKFYYYGMEQDVFLALQNGNFDILKNICLNTNSFNVLNEVKKIKKLINGLDNQETMQAIRKYILEEIQKRENYYQDKDINKYIKYYESISRKDKLMVEDIYNIFSKMHFNPEINEKGYVVKNSEITRFLLGNCKKNNDCLLRMVINKQALGINNELYNVVNNYSKIKKEIACNKELSLYSLLDVIDISKVILYKLKPDELDITLNTLSKILNSRKYLKEDPDKIIKKVFALHKERKKRVYATFPFIKGKVDDMSYEVASLDDEALLCAGIDGGDCFKVGGLGEDFLRYCLTNENGGVMYIYNNNDKYILPFSRNGNMININSIDPKIKDEMTLQKIIKAVKNISMEWMNYPNSLIDLVTITDVHISDFMKNMSLDKITFAKAIPLDAPIYTDYNKDIVTNYIVANKENCKANYEEKLDVKFYQIRKKPYVYETDYDGDDERIDILINSINYTNIEYLCKNDTDKNNLKNNYKYLKASDYKYIYGNKDWFMAVDYDGNILSCILPFDYRAETEYKECLENYKNDILKGYNVKKKI